MIKTARIRTRSIPIPPEPECPPACFVPEGPPGDDGLSGVNGMDGLTIRGEDGADGADAFPIPGPPGTDGAQGINGLTIRGEDGENGADGMIIPGLPGVDGLNGLTIRGADGEDGADGFSIPGLPGVNGVDGVPGIRGEDGADGVEGMFGSIVNNLGTMAMQFAAALTLSLVPAVTAAVSLGDATHGWKQLFVDTGVITTNQPGITVAQTWNNAAVTFVADFRNITATASAAASLLAQWQVGAADKLTVDKTGILRSFTNGGIAIGGYPNGGNAVGFGRNSSSGYMQLYGGTTGTGSDANADGALTGLGFIVKALGKFLWSSTTNPGNPIIDTGLGRNAAGVVEINSGTAGTFRDLIVQKVTTFPTTVGGLPAAAAGLKGARSFVTDATTTIALGLGLAVVGGGANNVPVYCDGAAWLIG